LEWIHVCLLNGAYLAEPYNVPKKIKICAVQTSNSKYITIQSLDHTAAAIDVGKDKKLPLINFVSVDPAKVVLKFNSDYISIDSQGKLAAKSSKEEAAAVFKMIRLSAQKFALRTENDNLVSMSTTHLIVIPANIISPKETFTEIPPPITASIQINSNSTFLSVTKSGQITAKSRKIQSSGKFILERITRNVFTIKSSFGKFFTITSDKKIAATKDSVTSLETFCLERLPTGFYWIKCTSGGSYLHVDANGCLVIFGMKSPKETGEFVILYQ